MQLTRLDRPDLKDEPWVPITQPRLARAKDASRFFDEIRRGDMLVHQPYESFRTSFEAFAAAAAADPDVIAMKTAVYRTSDDSALVSALIDCAEDRASRPSASSSSRPASTSGGTSSGRASSSRRACTSCTASPT